MVDTKNDNNIFVNIDQVTKNFRDPSSNIFFQALRGIDLKVTKGSLSSIIGPSGAGKSTLLNILGGMIAPTTGSVFVDGNNLNLLSQRDLIRYQREYVGFLWQFPDRNLLPRLSALKNVMYCMEVSGYPLESRKKRAKELLDSVGLRNRYDHHLAQLSGGEAQRASLAVALANEPSLLLADEPTGELDTETTLEIVDYLRELNQEKDITMLIVTHDTRFEKLTDNAYHILDGSIAEVRRTKDLAQTDFTQLSLDMKIDQLGLLEQDEVSFINQFGMVKIPNHIREKYGFTNYARFIENSELGKVVIEPEHMEDGV